MLADGSNALIQIKFPVEPRPLEGVTMEVEELLNAKPGDKLSPNILSESYCCSVMSVECCVDAGSSIMTSGKIRFWEDKCEMRERSPSMSRRAEQTIQSGK